MKKNISYLITLLFISLTACENEIPFNIKDNSSKLIINALINADSVRNIVYLNFSGKSQLSNVKDATVNVYVNNVLIETAQPINEQNESIVQSTYLITSAFHPGDVIRIDAKADANGSTYNAWAEVIVPQRPQIVSVDTCSIMLKTSNGFNDHMRYKIRIKDRENETNFYRIILEQQTSLNVTQYYNNQDTTTISKSYYMVTREDVVLTDGHPMTSDDEDNSLFEETRNIYNVFDDGRFTNKEYTMTIYGSSLKETWLSYENVNQAQVDVTVRLLSITEVEYYYLKALNIIDSDTYIEGINEPIKIPSNVQGGIGFVGVSAEHRYLLHLPVQTFHQ
ncbi:DUF4249 domain-containing protein [Bacteroides ihuae]|uniref:DUF4249 domain-containing protein n=1 Tax=Bacteroides ihuae TaxID=1852362 RepID=UPI0008D9667F|nr:DUF4249 domain-containing protein [Bacteroides ihuae]